MMFARLLVYWTILHCFACSLHHRQFACVKNCRCNRQKQMIHCSNEGLTHVLRFSPLAKTLILDDNQLVALDFELALNYTLDHFALVELSIRRNNLTSSMLISTSFDRFNELKFLHLDGNKLTYLGAGLFNNNPLLERLTLSGNPLSIHEISAMSAFLSLHLSSSLKYLDLSKTLAVGNDDELPSFLSNMSALEELILHNTYFKNVTTEVFSPINSLPNLKHLDLSEATIEFVDDTAFSGLKTVSELDLSGANINAEAVARMLRGLNNSYVEVLNMDRVFVRNSSGTKVIHDLFHRFNASRLRVLNMDGNFMAFRGRLPEKLLHPLRHLNDLFLESCNLLSVPTNAFQGLNLVKKLSLKHNLLSCVRGSECHFLQGPTLKHLRYLDLSNNRLSDIENSIVFTESVFPILEFLDLKFNNLATVSDTMFNSLPKLVQLDLSYNPIEEIEANSFRQISSLTMLNLEGCKHLIRLKHGAFNGLLSLRVLNLRDSGLTHIHHTALSHLSHLEELYLRRNKFSESRDPLENVTIHRSALKTLDIGENGLENIPRGLVSKSYDLLTLYSDGNRIRDCNELKDIAGARTVETLDLSNNNLAHITRECFESFTNLKSLDLSGNPFACTCSTPEVFQWLFASGFVDTSHYGYRCASPLEKINQNIFYQPSNLDCQGFRNVFLIASLFILFVAVLVLAVAVYCVLRKKIATPTLPKVSQSHTRCRGDVYSPLDEEDTARNGAVIESCLRQSIDSCNDECHYFDNDYQHQALVDKGRNKGHGNEERKTFRSYMGNGFFGKHKYAHSKKPYKNGLNTNKMRTPIEPEAACALSRVGENEDRYSKISSLDTVDRKTLTLEVTSANSLDCDIHLEDSVL